MADKNTQTHVHVHTGTLIGCKMQWSAGLL